MSAPDKQESPKDRLRRQRSRDITLMLLIPIFIAGAAAFQINTWISVRLDDARSLRDLAYFALMIVGTIPMIAFALLGGKRVNARNIMLFMLGGQLFLLLAMLGQLVWFLYIR